MCESIMSRGTGTLVSKQQSVSMMMLLRLTIFGSPVSLPHDTSGNPPAEQRNTGSARGVARPSRAPMYASCSTQKLGSGSSGPKARSECFMRRLMADSSCFWKFPSSSVSGSLVMQAYSSEKAISTMSCAKSCCSAHHACHASVLGNNTLKAAWFQSSALSVLCNQIT